jgi:hypothetical protein
MSRNTIQRLKQLEDQMTRLDSKKRELGYLTVDPLLYAKAKALLTKDSDENISGDPASEKPS